jgi:hypothetical protein
VSPAEDIVGGGSAPSAAQQLVLPGVEVSPREAAEMYLAAGFEPIALWWVEQDEAGAWVCQCEKHGRKLLPGHRAGKHPIVLSGWTTNPVDLSEWDRYPLAGIGLRMGGAGRFVAIDIDGELGPRALVDLERKHGVLPRTLTARTGSGGEHRLFRVSDSFDLAAIRNSVKGIGANLDVRTTGGQIVGAPTMHEAGRRYEWIDRSPPADMPEWLYIVCAKPRGAAAGPAPVTQAPDPTPPTQRRQTKGRPDAETRASKWLKHVPGGIDGSGGSIPAFDAALGLVRGFALSPSVALRMLAHEYNPRCQPAWTEAELQHKVNSAAATSVPLGYLLDKDPPERHRSRRAHAPPGSPPPVSAATRARELSPEDKQRLQDSLRPMLAKVAGLAQPVAATDLPDAGEPANDLDSPPGYTPPPEIKMDGGELPANVADGVRALAADKDLYKRDHALVHVTHVTKAEEESGRRSDGEKTLVAGTPRIHGMHPDTLRVRLCQWARWMKYDKREKDYVHAEPTDHIVGAIAHAKEWHDLRRLVGIIESPSLRPDGTVLDVPGYDAATGFIYAPSANFRRIQENPSREDARRTLRYLLDEVYPDFPYVAEAGRSTALAAALTLVARPAIDGATPVFLFDATLPGSGKTLQADVASVIATGREAGRQHFPFVEGRDRDSELQKVLSSAARRGAALINFDNLDAGNGLFGGSALELIVTTRDTYSFRILGKTEDLTVSWRTVVFGSGNNAELTRDMGRRTLVARLESTFENPESRPLSSYRRPDRANRLLEWVAAHRVDIVDACLTLLRAYVVAGRPKVTNVWPAFESWSSLIAGAIVWAGGADPMGCRPSEQGQESPDKTQHRVLVREWARFDANTGSGGTTVKSALALLYTTDRLKNPNQAPDGWDDLRAALEYFSPPKPGCAPDGRVLGERVFRRFKGAVIGTPPRKLEPAGTSGGVARWRVVEVVPLRIEAEDLEREAIRDQPTWTEGTVMCRKCGLAREMPDGSLIPPSADTCHH